MVKINGIEQIKQISHLIAAILHSLAFRSKKNFSIFLGMNNFIMENIVHVKVREN